MSWRDELTMIAAALAILLGGALLGASIAVIARANGTPTTAARVGGCMADEPCPLAP
jgi:hypothetical protein